MKAPLFFLNTDTKILDLIRKGDEEALVMLHEANRKMIMAYAARNNGTADDGEDLLQDALMVLWERVRAGRFDYSAKLSTFLFATAQNLWLRRLAKKRRESPGILDPDSHPDGEVSPLEHLIENEEATLVQEALKTIGEQCRQLLLLFYWEELSMEEIAARMGFANADTVKSKKYQCKKALERVLVGVMKVR